MLLNLINKKIILGSQSPRRKELLQNIGVEFTTQKVDFDESYPSDLKLKKVTQFLVNKKLQCFDLKKNEILIVSDTIVVSKNKILEKPNNEHQAKEMLSRLSNSKHLVYTSVGIKSTEKEVIFTDVTKVYFNEILPLEIEHYVSNFKPFDKAGSYGIQDWLGICKISKIKGSFYTVMGLPTHLVYQYLLKF
jgi:septum formation protein